MGYFSEVSVSIEELPDGVGVIFVVTEKPPLVAVKFVCLRASHRLVGVFNMPPHGEGKGVEIMIQNIF